ncbi:MAG: DNA cytosine methyltransferase [Rhodobacteraceae bacterium]|nr:MAG: DNA cytosine methyltransferase [Paracoccaceae bacterium]
MDGTLFQIWPDQPRIDDPRPMIIDSFAGGGGASTGIEMALGRSPDVAINHNPDALALHAANHPETLHLINSVYAVSPDDVCAGREVGLAWFSPDCKHFSKAKGGKPVAKNIRDLAWVVVHWAERVKPCVIILENVEEFQDWCPLDENNYPDKTRKGETFRAWVKALKKLGYKIEWRELRACDYGAPTIRKRLFVVARCDGQPIIWPAPTHGDGRAPYHTAAECIDWSIPCPSIFDTSAQIKEKFSIRANRPLAENTLSRVARGMKRYVLDAEEPFIVGVGGRMGQSPERSVNDPFQTLTAKTDAALCVPSLMSLKGTSRRDSAVTAPHPTILAGGGHSALISPVLTYAQQGGGCRDIRDPHHTICANSKDQNSVIIPTLIQTGYGERKGQAPRSLDINAPLGTVVAGGIKHATAAAFLAQQNGGPKMDNHAGRDLRDPMSTVTAAGSPPTPSPSTAATSTRWAVQHDRPLDRGICPQPGRKGTSRPRRAGAAGNRKGDRKVTDIVERLDAVIEPFGPEIMNLEQAARDEITRLHAEIAAAEAREAKLREYYEANEAIAETGLIAATTEMLSRLRKARAALSEKKGGRDGCGV